MYLICTGVEPRHLAGEDGNALREVRYKMAKLLLLNILKRVNEPTENENEIVDVADAEKREIPQIPGGKGREAVDQCRKCKKRHEELVMCDTCPVSICKVHITKKEAFLLNKDHFFCKTCLQKPPAYPNRFKNHLVEVLHAAS